jgi:hypothetical protein
MLACYNAADGTFVTLLLLSIGFAFLGFFLGRGRQEAMRGNESRRDGANADRLMAEVRQELAARRSDAGEEKR